MKKIIVSIFLILFSTNLAFAKEVSKITLNKGALYLLLLDNQATDFKISNPSIVSFQIVSTLDNNGQQVILKTLNYGSTTFDIQTLSGIYNYDCKVVDGAITVNDDFFEIEKPNKESSK